MGDADAALLEALKALRTRLAQAQKVPAYVVFSDRTLIELATHRPATPRAMREIHGVGDTKLERYGAAFLAVMRGGGLIAFSDAAIGITRRVRSSRSHSPPQMNRPR